MCHSAENKFHRIRNYADSYGETGTGGNFRLSTAAPRQFSTAHVITQPQKLHSQLEGVRDSCNVANDRFNVQFHIRHESPTGRRHHNNLAGHAHHLLLFHVRSANQPTITDTDHEKGYGPFPIKNVGRLWFTELRAIRYQPFVLVHNA